MEKENTIRRKSCEFALSIIGLYRKLRDRREFVLAQQFLRSGTSIGANVEEAQGAQSRRDFHTKLTIAHKETKETVYWLRLFRDSKLAGLNYEDYIKEAEEHDRILASITKKTKAT